MKKRLLLVELNEFNEELLREASCKFKLKNIQKLLSLKSSKTRSQDNQEHFGLDPWVQWVSIHTGQPSNIHNIKHLGDVEDLNNIQIWEELGNHGFSSGIWGAMNASLKNTKCSCFFLPDPWTFSEKAVPNKLNNFLSLPRYYAKNYLKPSIKYLFKSSINLINFLLLDFNFFYAIKEIIYSTKIILFYGLNNTILFSLFDLISHKIFIRYKKKYDPNFSLIFLNCLAHAQHESWGVDRINNGIKITLIVVDKILGNLFLNINKNESLVVINGLGQKNVDGQEYCIYRQIDPIYFLSAMGIKFKNLEQCMTNESHVFFQTKKELNVAFDLLNEATVGGKKMFHVELKKNGYGLFYQLDIFEKINIDEKFIFGDNTFKFYKFFDLLALRTGAHVPVGKTFYQNISLNKSFYNHQIYKPILNFFLK